MNKLTKPILLKTRRTCIRSLTVKDYNAFKVRIENLPPPKSKYDFATLFPTDKSKTTYRKFLEGILTTKKEEIYGLQFSIRKPMNGWD